MLELAALDATCTILLRQNGHQGHIEQFVEGDDNQGVCMGTEVTHSGVRSEIPIQGGAACAQ